MEWRPEYIEWLLRIGAAIIAGLTLGLERGFRGKAAGLKTMMLISLGSCLFMLVSEAVSIRSTSVSDPARIAAQVVTGVGFLGAGAIITSKHRVTGLTTAATIWVSASIGLVIGIGEILLGLMITTVALFSVLIVGFIERRFAIFGDRNQNGLP